MNLCGSCAHCDQTISGFRRWCDIRKRLVYALDKPCQNYRDIFEKDLFGESLYEKMIRERIAEQKEEMI